MPVHTVPAVGLRRTPWHTVYGTNTGMDAYSPDHTKSPLCVTHASLLRVRAGGQPVAAAVAAAAAGGGAGGGAAAAGGHAGGTGGGAAAGQGAAGRVGVGVGVGLPP